jgi:hypothetical protein
MTEHATNTPRYAPKVYRESFYAAPEVWHRENPGRPNRALCVSTLFLDIAKARDTPPDGKLCLVCARQIERINLLRTHGAATAAKEE